MKPQIKILVFTIFICGFSFAQNLVPNNSFENISSCPISVAQLSLSSPWFSPTLNNFGDSPDLYNQCSINMGVPTNILGFQYARTGIGYSGIILYDSANGREYIETSLISPLISGKNYCVEFYINLSNNSHFAIDGFGAYLSIDSSLSNNNQILSYIPQISNSNGNIISDTLNWKLISGQFIASGGEKFITIGNFKDDLTTNVNTESGTGVYAYYYIDDVSVFICDSSSSLGNMPNVFTPNNDGVNDIFEINSSNLKDFKLSIYNRWGTKVYDFISPNDAWDGYTTTGEPCSEGVYFYFLTAKGEDGKDFEQKGCIQLLR